MANAPSPPHPSATAPGTKDSPAPKSTAQPAPAALQDLTCVDTIAQECTGVFTPNQTCGDVDCQPYAGYGACCLGTGCVDNVLAADCEGDWFEGTLCGDVDCLTGACCLDGVCTITTAPKCGGTWYEGLTCTDVDCTTGALLPAGSQLRRHHRRGMRRRLHAESDVRRHRLPALRRLRRAALPDGTCAENQIQKDCESIGGIWREQDLCDNALCPPIDALLHRSRWLLDHLRKRLPAAQLLDPGRRLRPQPLHHSRSDRGLLPARRHLRGRCHPSRVLRVRRHRLAGRHTVRCG